MSDSLRDQLLGLGFKPAPAPEKPNRPKPGRDASARGAQPQDARQRPKPHGKPHHAQDRPKPQGKPHPQHRAKPHDQARTREEIDLAKAYAIRAQKEKDERIEAERQKQEAARLRREAKAKLAALLKDRSLNDPTAEIARHFEYGGKIKRIYVTDEQLKALNAGELGVVQLDGRYLLLTAALLAEAESIFAPSVALKVDPNAAAEEDPYADPQYQVPDDLVW